jgi:predicted nucleotidyltransferase
MTRDADIVVELLQPDIEKFAQIFEPEFYLSKEAIGEALQYESMFNIIHNETIFKIDFIIRKRSMYRVTEFRRKVRMKMDDVPVWVVSPEDLIISKLYWAKDSLSERQLNDVRNIMNGTQTLDKDYIQKWIEELELNQIYSQV